MVKGKWAEGIVPRNFHWVIKDRLAVCERPGGYGESHRRVRRTEEIIWIRENGFDPVVSLINAPSNLHNYSELDVYALHCPVPMPNPSTETLRRFFTLVGQNLHDGRRVLVHRQSVDDGLAGLLAGLLVWHGIVKVEHEAITIVERLLERQMGPTGRSIVSRSSLLIARAGD
jgi:hypothetical protein